MTPKIGIVDFGVGNLFSVDNAVKTLTKDRFISSNPEKLMSADCIIFPGVGSFADGMSRMRSQGLDTFMKDFYESGKPILGICLGMHLMFSEGDEGGENKGLGLIKGRIEKLKHRNNSRIPHIGWNDVYGDDLQEMEIMSGISQHSSFYFVHSYHAIPDEKIYSVYTDFYGLSIIAGVRKNNLFATQFHPEKSQTVGLQILKNFFDMVN